MGYDDAAFHDILYQLSCDRKMAARQTQIMVHGRRMGGGRSYKAEEGHTRRRKVIQGGGRSYKAEEGHTRRRKVIQGGGRSYKAEEGHTMRRKVIQGGGRSYKAEEEQQKNFVERSSNLYWAAVGRRKDVVID